MDLQNRIGGDLCPSRRAGRFQWRAALPPCELLVDAPRSGPEEVEAARAALARGTRSWWRRPHEERRRLVERGLARFAAEVQAAAPRLAAGLGLEAFEYEPELVQAARAGVVAARRARRAPLGVGLCVPDWRVRTGALVADLAWGLVEGRPLLLLADEHAPLVAELFVAALFDVGVPADVIALLHAPTDDAVAAAVRSGVERVSAWGDRERIARLRRLAAGAGVPTQRLRLHRTLPDRLPLGADPEDAAEETVRRAFGRAATLSGVRGGQLGTLYVPEREFSRFSEALIDALLESRAYQEPLPFADGTTARRAKEAWTLGLDEGATLVVGGEERGRDGERRVVPALLTNGHGAMRAARRVEPVPVLLLCRERG